ncbi:MAG: hypothetical protein R2730_05860 [Chitinophagales bacterium]
MNLEGIYNWHRYSNETYTPTIVFDSKEQYELYKKGNTGNLKFIELRPISESIMTYFDEFFSNWEIQNFKELVLDKRVYTSLTSFISSKEYPSVFKENLIPLLSVIQHTYIQVFNYQAPKKNEVAYSIFKDFNSSFKDSLGFIKAMKLYNDRYYKNDSQDELLSLSIKFKDSGTFTIKNFHINTFILDLVRNEFEEFKNGIPKKKLEENMLEFFNVRYNVMSLKQYKVQLSNCLYQWLLGDKIYKLASVDTPTPNDIIKAIHEIMNLAGIRIESDNPVKVIRNYIEVNRK